MSFQLRLLFCICLVSSLTPLQSSVFVGKTQQQSDFSCSAANAFIGAASYYASSRRKSFDRFSKSDFKKFFKKQLGSYANNPALQEQILKQFHLYEYSSFRQFIHKLPLTNKFFSDLDYRLNNPPWHVDTFPMGAAYYGSFEQDFPGINLDQLKRITKSYLNEFGPRQQIAAPTQLSPIPSPSTPTPIPDQLLEVKKIVSSEKNNCSQLKDEQQYLLERSGESHDKKNRYEDRHHALTLLENNKEAWSTQQYNLSTDACNLIKLQHKNIERFTTCSGIEIQQILHKEFIAITEKIALKSKFNKSYETNPFLTNIFEFAEMGLYYNHAGHIECAIDWAEVAWTCLDYVSAIGEGIIEGAEKTLEDFADIIQHPIHTIKNICESLSSAGAVLAKIIVTHAKLGITLHTNPTKFPEQLENSLEPVFAIASALAEQIDKIPPRELVKDATAAITNAILFQKCLSVLHKFFALAKQQLPTVLNNIKESEVATKYIFVPQEAPVLLAQEAALQLESIVATAQTIEGGVKDASAIKQAAQLVEQASHTNCQIIHALQQVLEPVYKELPKLAQLFDYQRKGFAEFANKYIKIPYEHIVAIEFKFGKNGISISGFHHDFMNIIENSGLLQFVDKKINKFGIIKADLLWNNRLIKNKTFFPSSWQREKVIQKIYEAYDDFIAKGAKALLTKDGKYQLIGLTNEGIEIEMIITKNGQITTAYPRFNL